MDVGVKGKPDQNEVESLSASGGYGYSGVNIEKYHNVMYG